MCDGSNVSRFDSSSLWPWKKQATVQWTLIACTSIIIDAIMFAGNKLTVLATDLHMHFLIIVCYL